MYQTLIFYHSIMRWLVLISLLIAIYAAWRGARTKAVFTKRDNLIRHWTATIAHIQLVVGILLYSKSPVTKYFWTNRAEAIHNKDVTFFSLVHLVLMLTAIVVITTGSALAKRKQTDHSKFSTMLGWYIIALLIILVAIPWPFSPFAHRPYWR
jgi:hypothetical protein